MIEVQTLLSRCRELGAEFTLTLEGKLKVKAPAPLPEDLRDALKQRKVEVLLLVEAMNWLRSQLTTPQHIASLVAEWVGTLDQPTGRRIDTLMDARRMLEVDAYVGDDSRFWWRISPHEREQ